MHSAHATRTVASLCQLLLVGLGDLVPAASLQGSKHVKTLPSRRRAKPDLSGAQDGHQAKGIAWNTQVHGKQLARLSFPPKSVHSANNEDSLRGCLPVIEPGALSIVISGHKGNNPASLPVLYVDLNHVAAQSSKKNIWVSCWHNATHSRLQARKAVRMSWRKEGPCLNVSVL